MRKHYHKLVRDRIPEIIQTSGKECLSEPYSDAGYRQALLDKLVEEAGEARQAAHGQALLVELADLLETLDALLLAHGFTEQQARTLQAQRRQERGGFEGRLCLLWVQEEPHDA